MANPQAEDGHLDIANDIAEAFARLHLTGNEWQCLWVIIRKTYGWKKKLDWIALDQFVAATGLKKPRICEALGSLLRKNVILKSAHGYGLNKDFDRWVTEKRNVTQNRKGVTEKRNEHSAEPEKPLRKSVPTKDKKATSTKATPTKETIARIVERYNELCPSLPTVTRLMDKRTRAIKARLNDKFTLIDLESAFVKAETSDFLSGRSGKWTGCNFDWIINETNLVKILEGSYDNKAGDRRANTDAIDGRAGDKYARITN